MDIKQRQQIERRIARQFIQDALHAGYSINVHNGGDDMELTLPSTSAKEILAVMFATDDEKLYLYRDGRCNGWVWFVYGNDGWDVITDYTTNLEPIMEATSELANRIADNL